MKKEWKRVHFVGIGGVGMSGIAKVMMEDGYIVSGSDLKPSYFAQRLAEKGARIYQGHLPEQLDDADLVIVSSAIPKDNTEALEAERRGIPVIKRAEMLGRLMRVRYGIAIAGTHGKTTTTSLIALILERAGLDPTILVGGEMVDLGTNAKLGQGPYLVAEADEFDGSFLHLAPRIAVVTNIEPEHLDYYSTPEALLEAFQSFVALVPPEGKVVFCFDDPGARNLTGMKNTLSYGFSPEAEWRGTNVKSRPTGGSDFSVEHKGNFVGDFQIGLPGRHNVSNALAAIAVSSILGIEMKRVRSTISAFRGARRRFELRGEVNGITIIDDYAHHPTEIRATLEAARERFGGRRIICVFQPHTYSRTKLLLSQFATCFTQADAVVIADIYAAREKDEWGISGADLARALHHPKASYIGDLHEIAIMLMQTLQPRDVLMVLGAGDVDKVSTELLESLSKR